MKILVVAATKEEINPFLGALPAGHEISHLITGPGMVPTAFMLGVYLHPGLDLVINAGIAGAFADDIPIGAVVNVTKDIFSEVGAEDGEDFLTLEGMNLIGIDKVENKNAPSNAVIDKLRKVTGVTVNRVHGNEASINKIRKRFSPDIESMEGAAFLYACKMASLKCLQLRAISNKVERRDKSKWDIPLAIKNLNEVLNNVICSL
jgi:futalosine hydrolase